MPSYCPHGVDENEAGCGKCLASDIAAGMTDDNASYEALAEVLVVMLDKIEGGTR
jgi:hypothetical protein